LFDRLILYVCARFRLTQAFVCKAFGGFGGFEGFYCGGFALNRAGGFIFIIS
jgi:hypothetical protein